MRKRNILYILIAIFLIFLMYILISNVSKNNMEVIKVSAQVNLSNKKVSWGIKRNSNHEQPDLGKKNKELIEKRDDLAIRKSR